MPSPKHIVAVAALVTNAQGHVLMIRSPRRDWEFPGGQVEEGETLTEALQREVYEETGVRIVVGKLAGVYSNTKSHIVMFDFLCEWIEGEPRISPESLEVAWMAREDALARILRSAIRERMRDMLEFNGQVVYRAYSFDANEGHTEYTVHEERRI